MRIFSTLLAATMGAFLFSISTPAQVPPDRTAFWKKVQDKCDDTATRFPDPSPIGAAIANAARNEHQLWGGHKIDHTGRLYRFGLVETESEESPSDTDKVSLGKIGWWNVWRYWATLHEKQLLDYSVLRIFAVEEAIESRSPEIEKTRREHYMKGLFETVAKIENKQTQEAIKEAVIRSMMSDRPWSAAFISYIVYKGGNVSNPDQFHFSRGHISYIASSLRTSRNETESKPVIHIYRACPIGTRPRIGDLVCYHRDNNCSGADSAAIRNLITFKDKVPGKDKCEKIEDTHCDVVVRVDQPALKIYSIGGNVLQSVTERRLRIQGKEQRFSTNQGEKPCLKDQSAAGDSQAVKKGKHCSLNNKEWFVLLQMRENPPAVASAGQ